MASANLNLVRSIYVTWERGDFSATAWAHPDIEFEIVDGPSPGRWVGVDEMARAWREFLSAWDRYGAAAEDYRELDAERVLTLTVFHATGKSSGLEVGQVQARGASLHRIRDGRATALSLYFDRDRAFSDLGIEPEPDAAD
jgi:ketosteroid isomerase-like protein